MKELKSLWKKIEKQTIYAVLFLYFLLQLVAIFIPGISSFMDARGSLMLIAFVLLFIFKYLDDRLDGSSATIALPTKGFVQGVVNLLQNNREYRRVDVFAYNGYSYFMAIKESGVKIDNMRILLRSDLELSDLKFIVDNQSREYFRQQARQMVENFKQLQREGQVKNLAVEHYNFDPTHFFMVADGEYLHFGVFQLQDSYPGIDASQAYIVHNNGELGESLLRDFSLHFEKIWNKYAKKIS